MYTKLPELKRVSFQYLNKVLQEIDEKYHFMMPNWLVIIIIVVRTTVTIIIVRMI